MLWTWPRQACPLHLQQVGSRDFEGLTAEAWDFDSQEHVPLRLYVASSRPAAGTRRLHVFVGGANPIGRDAIAAWRAMFPDDFSDSDIPQSEAAAPAKTEGIAVLVLPRGLGRARWSANDKKQVQIRRRFMLLGQTLATMRAWDVRRVLEALAEIPLCRDASETTLHGDGDLAAVALYASLFSPRELSLSLTSLPPGDEQLPDVLNLLRFVRLPHLLALAAGKCRGIEVFADEIGDCRFAIEVSKRFGGGPIVVHRSAVEESN